jgi:hypothetical protein
MPRHAGPRDDFRPIDFMQGRGPNDTVVLYSSTRVLYSNLHVLQVLQRPVHHSCGIIGITFTKQPNYNSNNLHPSKLAVTRYNYSTAQIQVDE